MNIIEVISQRSGIVTTPFQSRLSVMKPGDVIDFGYNHGYYPFTHGRYGRIDSFWKHKGEPDNISICCGGASVFLCDSGNVSISGGPFTSARPDELEPTDRLMDATFWNWGNLGPGGGNGVYYTFERPVFLLALRKTGHIYTDATNFIACPKCGVKPMDLCMGGPTPVSSLKPHLERIDKYATEQGLDEQQVYERCTWAKIS